MRENHLETPQREHSLANRRSISMSNQIKRSHKPIIAKNSVADSAGAAGDAPWTKSGQESTRITDSATKMMMAKSLDAEEFTGASEDVSVTKPEEDSTVISGSSSMIAKSLNAEFEAASGEVSAAKDSSAITESAGASEQSSRISMVETEMLVRRLRELRGQVFNCSELNPMSKKLCDTLVCTIIEDFTSISGGTEGLHYLNIRKKAHVVLLSFFLWLVLVSAFLLSVSGGQQTYAGQRPT